MKSGLIAICAISLLQCACVGGPVSALRQFERAQRDQEREMAAQRRDMAREDRAASRQAEREEQLKQGRIAPGEEMLSADQTKRPQADTANGKKAIGPFVTLDDPSAVLDTYDQHQTLDFGDEGERRTIHLAGNKGQRPKIIVLAQIKTVGAPKGTPPLWAKTAEQEVRSNTNGLVFVGTNDESENAPAIRCSVDGRTKQVFGFMKKGKAPLYSGSNKALLWSLDENHQLTPVSGKKIVCDA